MNVTIKETGKVVDLTIIDPYLDCEWTDHLIKDTWDDLSGEYVMSQADYDQWKQYIVDYEADEKEIVNLAEQLNIDEPEIYDRIKIAMEGRDYNDDHKITQAVLQALRQEHCQ